MISVLIPAELKALKDAVERCLSLAKAQGLNAEQVVLGMSPTPLVQLIQHSDTSQEHDTLLNIESDLFSHHDSSVNDGLTSVVDYGFYYHTDLSVAQCAQQNSAAIYLGVLDSHSTAPHQQLDIWRHPLNHEIRALSFTVDSAKPAASEHHFAWVITLLGLDFPLEDALTLARAAVMVSRETPFDTWPVDYREFPTPVLEDKRLGIQVGWSLRDQASEFAVLQKNSLGLYPVVNDVAWIERLLPLGIKTIQLRIKDPQQSDLEAQIVRAIELGRQYDAQVFINDYWQLAVKHGAFGVHLGQEDIEQSNLTQLQQAGVHLGLSTHGYYELLRIVQIHPSYIALGHIFPTTTKQMPSKPQGLVRLALYQQLLNTIPYAQSVGYSTVAIGGIDLTNAAQVWKCGVSSLAVVRAITLAEKPQDVIQAFKRIMEVCDAQ